MREIQTQNTRGYWCSKNMKKGEQIMADIKLKKCPFCGGKAILGTMPYNGWFRVMCAGCCASSAKYSTEERAAEAWNRREENG